MAHDGSDDEPQAASCPQPPGGNAQDKLGQPAWAGRLRELYNSVVEEPLPDCFAELLAKLDSPGE